MEKWFDSEHGVGKNNKLLSTVALWNLIGKIEIFSTRNLFCLKFADVSRKIGPSFEFWKKGWDS